jgi:predicted DCC family thiol-disulfide oxidoreductase YuxK
MAAAPLILFDGHCNLCNGAVQWLIRRDRRNLLRFASLQSDAGRAAVAATGRTEALPDSLVLIDANGGTPRLRLRSDAAIGIARLLGFPWSLAVVGLIMPRVLRDALYNFIARNRYRWFGKRDTCMLPTPALRARFLDTTAAPPRTPAPGEAGERAPASGPS